jgi:hypothetical protein
MSIDFNTLIRYTMTIKVTIDVHVVNTPKDVEEVSNAYRFIDVNVVDKKAYDVEFAVVVVVLDTISSPPPSCSKNSA